MLLQFDALLSPAGVALRLPTSTELWISSGSYPEANQTVALEIIQMADTETVIGLVVKRYLFDYRQNPILEDINPRKTILR